MRGLRAEVVGDSAQHFQGELGLQSRGRRRIGRRGGEDTAVKFSGGGSRIERGVLLMRMILMKKESRARGQAAELCLRHQVELRLPHVLLGVRVQSKCLDQQCGISILDMG